MSTFNTSMQRHNWKTQKPRSEDLGFDDFRRPDFEVDAVYHGFTAVFYCHYLESNADCNLSFQRKYQCLELNTQKYYVMRAEVGLKDETMMALGSGYSLEIASDAACYNLSNVIKDRYPLYCMPKYLMGYPNVRGHCYVISALVPLLYCVPFVRILTQANMMYQLGYLQGQYKVTSNIKAREEVPFYWTDLLYKVYRTFRNLSHFEQTIPKVSSLERSDNCDSHERPCRGKITTPASAILDQSLFGDLINSLAIYVNSAFRKGGGDEREAYRCLMLKMSSKIPEVVNELMMSVSGTYSCSGCVGLYSDRFVTPFIRVPSFNVDFQFILNCPEKMIAYQRFRSVHRLPNGSRCCYKVSEFVEGRIENAPQLLVFAVDFRVHIPSVIYPSELYLDLNGDRYSYNHYASSVCFPCYKSKDGYDYGEFYHPYVVGYTRVDQDHTYVQVRSGGYHEVNNGSIYTIDDRIHLLFV